jgi:hypothetical protein
VIIEQPPVYVEQPTPPPAPPAPPAYWYYCSSGNAYNLGNLLRRLVLPLAIQSWSLTSLRQRLFKTGGRLVRHARSFVLQLAESYLTRRFFRQILGRIGRLAGHPT